MDFINKIKKLGNIQKILILGGILLFLISIISVANIARRREEKFAVLYSELNIRDAGAVVKSLQDMKIPYKLTNEGRTILVPEDKVYEVRLNLAQKGIPTGGVVGYEVFDKITIGMTDFVQQVNFKRALEGELTRTILSLKEVKNARVHIVLPKERLFIEDQKEPTASIMLELFHPLTESQIKGITHLIASSVEGLSPHNITILDQYGNMLYGIPKEEHNENIISSSLQFQIKKDVEKYLANKAQTMLEEVIGKGNAIVKVDVELDFINVIKTIERYDPEEQVVRSEEKHIGIEGKRSSIINYEISRSVEQIVDKKGTIKRISASAVVNGTYKPVDKKRRIEYEYIPRTEEEMRKFYVIVKNAIGYNPERGDSVEVVNITFGPPPLPIEKPPALPMILAQIRGIIVPIVIAIIIFYIIKLVLQTIFKKPQPEIVQKEQPMLEKEKEPTFEKIKSEISKKAGEEPEKFASIIKKIIKEG